MIIIWIIIIIENYIVYFDSIINIKYHEHLVQSMRDRGLKMLADINIDYYRKNKIGDTLLKLNREIDEAALHLKSCQKIFTLTSIIFVIICFLLSISWQLTTVYIVLSWLVTITKKRLILWMKNLANRKTQTSTFYTRKIVDFLVGIKFIKSVDNEKSEYFNVIQTLKKEDKTKFQAEIILAMISPVIEIIRTDSILTQVIIGYYLYQLLLQEFRPIILTFFAVLLRLFPILSQLINARTQFINSRSSTKNIANFLDKTKHNIEKAGTLTFLAIDSTIKFINVTFAYLNHDQMILDKVNLNFNGGINTAIIEPIETEKNAIIELLLRFYDPIEGIITVNQNDIQAYKQND